jgi:His/Glu/Gln/Arg/opine family amino acid ABC transporter permease subunit
VFQLSRYEFRWDVALENLPFLLQGLKYTVLISVLSMAAGLVIGLFVAVGRLSRYRVVRYPAYVYTEVFRTLPLLVLLVWMHWTVPILTGVTVPAVTTAVVAFSLNLGAFAAENYRAGIMSISPGQREAAMALGMTPTQVMSRIILPQAVARVIPPMGSLWVSLFKDTSLVSIIAVPDLLYQGRVLSVNLYRPMEILTAVAVIYYLLTYPQSRLVNWLYRRYMPEA